MSKIGEVAMAARRPEHEGIKEALRSAERLRAIGVTLGRTRDMFDRDSWAKERPDARHPGR